MTKPKVIYEPKGRALEYSELALNLFTGCCHSCKYCFAPGITRKKKVDFHANPTIREDILDRLEKDCILLEGDPREVLMCFMTDPYQPYHDFFDITRKTLLLLETYNMKAQILTKAGLLASRDFYILQRNNWKFGTTLCFTNEELRRQWEPDASTIESRIEAIEYATDMGISTWVSIEPVMFPTEALDVIDKLKHTVDFFKIGKINYNKWYEDRVNWKNFVKDVQGKLKPDQYYIKKDTCEAAGIEWIPMEKI